MQERIPKQCENFSHRNRTQILLPPSFRHCFSFTISILINGCPIAFRLRNSRIPNPNLKMRERKSIYDTGEKLKESKLRVALCPCIFCFIRINRAHPQIPSLLPHSSPTTPAVSVTQFFPFLQFPISFCSI